METNEIIKHAAFPIHTPKAQTTPTKQPSSGVMFEALLDEFIRISLLMMMTTTIQAFDGCNKSFILAKDDQRYQRQQSSF